jgi:small GTP-binding protein domain
VVIAGQVNVGKSSLLNALIGRNRAIVTSQPGTTRDFLEENLLIDGLPVRLVDTAGLRKTRDEVEQQGLRLARELFSEADLILLLVDVASGPSGYELELLEKYGPDKILGVANKCDLAKALGPLWPEGGVRKEYAGLRELGWIDVSAKFGQGIDALAEAIRGRLLETGPNGGGERDFAWNIAPNLRQAGVLKTAGEEIDGILEDLSLGVPYDLVGVRVELLSAILAEVSGEIAAEDVLDRIFSEFCLGK